MRSSFFRARRRQCVPGEPPLSLDESVIPFRRVAIHGVGLIGGSLGMALKRSDSRVSIRGIGRDVARLERARQLGAIDEYRTDLDGVSDVDLVVLATPVEHILETLEIIGQYLSEGTLVTDVGSTKRKIGRKAEDCLPATIEFIPGHPIAGRERGGVENSLPDLFERAPYVLCPGSRERSSSLGKLVQTVKAIGAEPAVISVEEHDRILAWSSHLPQVLSTALASLSLEQETHGYPLVRLSGNGFRDVLRLAGSPYSVWEGILESNADNIELALEEFIQHLEQVRTGLKQKSLSADFGRAVEFYGRLRQSKEQSSGD
jgi:prephenate dehydrogenase